MLNKSVLLMSAVAVSLTTGITADATKSKQVTLDGWVQRKGPQRSQVVIEMKKKSPPKKEKKKYLNPEKLTKFQEAYLNKIY